MSCGPIRESNGSMEKLPVFQAVLKEPKLLSHVWFTAVYVKEPEGLIIECTYNIRQKRLKLKY